MRILTLVVLLAMAMVMFGCPPVVKAKDYHPWPSSNTLRTNPPGPAYPDQAMGK